jgi:hypothetical protein
MNCAQHSLKFRVSTILSLTALLAFPLGLRAGAFTPGNLAVLSADIAAANNTTFSILELSPATANQSPVVQTIAINGTTGDTALRISGSAGTTGKLGDSGDGTLLVFAAENSPGTTGNADTNLARGVGTLDANGNFTLQMTYTGVSGNQVRNATTVNNLTLYAGDQGGIYTNGSTTALTNANIQAVKNFGGPIFALQKSKNTICVSTVSANGPTLTGLSGLVYDGNASDFYLVSSGKNGTTNDVLYVLDQTSATAGVINKFFSATGAGGTWKAAGTYATLFGGDGLAAATNGGGGVWLYVTSGDGTVAGNRVLQLTDTSAWNVTLNITTASNVTLYTAATGTTIKGVAFAPITTPTVTAAAATDLGPTTATLNGSVTATGGAAITSRGFIDTPANGVPVTNTVAGTTGAYTLSLATLSPNVDYDFTAFAVNAVGTALSAPAPDFWTLAKTPATPTVKNATLTSLAVAVGSGDGNPADTTYALLETTTTNYVQADGTLNGTVVFQTAAVWGTVTVGGLNSGQTYKFAAVAQNGAGTNTGFGPATSGTTLAPTVPTITIGSLTLTFPPTAVNRASPVQTYTVSGAKLTANIVITAPAGFQISTVSGSADGPSVTLTESGGTVAATTLYVQFAPTAQTAYAGDITNASTGAVSRNVAVSGTGALAPSVSTQPASALTATGARLHGTVTANNGAPLTDSGFYWSTSPGVTLSATQLSTGGTTVTPFAQPWSGLGVNTRYYYRAYAVNSIGTTLDPSGDTTFCTLANPPVVPTVGQPATNSLTVTIGAGDGNPTDTTYALVETNSGDYVQPGGALGTNAVYQTAAVWGIQTVTGLELGTRYAFAVQALNLAGTATALGPATSAKTANGSFTPGDLVVLSADDASLNNTTFSLIELKPATAGQTAVQTFNLNGANDTAGTALRTSGTASTAPKLTDSDDGTLLVFAGFNTNNPNGSINTNLQRGVGTLNGNGVFTLQTTYTGVAGNPVRGAATLDDTNWFIAEGSSGIYTNGTGPTPLLASNVYSLKSFGGTATSRRLDQRFHPVGQRDGSDRSQRPGARRQCGGFLPAGFGQQRFRLRHIIRFG